jgi:hypothetical protein
MGASADMLWEPDSPEWFGDTVSIVNCDFNFEALLIILGPGTLHGPELFTVVSRHHTQPRANTG